MFRDCVLKIMFKYVINPFDREIKGNFEDHKQKQYTYSVLSDSCI